MLRARLLLVAVALLAGLCAVAWFARGDVAAPIAPARASALRGAACGAASDGCAKPAATADEPAALARRVAAGVGADEPTVPADAIVGFVVDEAGAPVAGAELSVDHPHVWMAAGCSDATGAFAVARGSEDRCNRARLRCRHPAFDEFFGWLRWGEHARIVLPSRIAVEVTVVDAAGMPVEVQCVEVTRIDDFSSAKLERIGAAWCGQLRRGRYSVVVDPVRLRRGFSPAQRDPSALVVSPPGPVRLQVGLWQSGTRRVRVLDAGGEAAAYAIVQLVEATGPAPVRDPGRYRAGKHGVTIVGRPAEFMVREEAVADGRGETILDGWRGHTYSVIASKSRFVTAKVDGVALDDGEPVVVELGAAANVTGRVIAGPPITDWIAAGRCRPALVDASGQEASSRSVWPEPRVAADGSFALTAVSPGRRYLRLQGAREVWSGPLDIVAGENAPLLIDLRGWRQVEVQLHVVVDGRPLVSSAVDIAAADAPVANASRCVVTDGDGCATVALRPGRHRVTLLPRDGDTVAELAGLSAVIDVAGARAECDVALSTGELALAFVDTRGVPVPGMCISLRRGDEAPTSSVDADGDGNLRLRRAPGEWTVTAMVLPAWATGSDIDPIAVGAAPADLGRVCVRAGATTTARYVVPEHLLPR